MEGERNTDTITISWGKEKIRLSFDKKEEGKTEQVQEGGSLENVTLKQLKERLKKITGVPINGQKIIFSGAVMKDENATLSSFGLHDNSRIMMIGSKPNENDLAETSTSSSEEYVLMQKITQSLNKIKTTLIPQIESFEISVKSFLAAASSTPPSSSNISNDNNDNDNDLLLAEDTNLKTKLQDMHHHIVENLMQSLLILDGIDFSNSLEFKIARQKRKEAVKFTQQLIDRVDEVKAKLLKTNNNNNDIISSDVNSNNDEGIAGEESVVGGQNAE